MKKLSVRFRIAIALLVLVPAAYLSFLDFPAKKSETVSLVGKNVPASGDESIVLLDSSRNIYDVSNFTGGIYLLEFSDGNCQECVRREKVLRKLAQQYMKAPFRIVYIHSGSNLSFDDFAQGGDRKTFRLYDEGGRFSDKLGIRNFPTELLLDTTGSARHAYTGFESINDDEYLTLARQKIDSLLIPLTVVSD